MMAKSSFFLVFGNYEVESENAIEFLHPHTHLRDSHFRPLGIYVYICSIYYSFVFLMWIYLSALLVWKGKLYFFSLLISKSSLYVMLNYIRLVGENERMLWAVKKSCLNKNSNKASTKQPLLCKVLYVY